MIGVSDIIAYSTVRQNGFSNLLERIMPWFLLSELHSLLTYPNNLNPRLIYCG
ncbi:hypothetical protein MOVI109754_22015 [Moritella viscosa]